MKFIEEIKQSVKDLREVSKTWPDQASIIVEKNRLEKLFNNLNSCRNHNGLLSFNSINDLTSYIKIKEASYLKFMKYSSLKIVSCSVSNLSNEDLITYFILNFNYRGDRTKNEFIKCNELISREFFVRKLKF